ncbi:protein-L-isoaspartate(D-aspartate) O-methyltransferase [Longimicrobium sp.]|uniref:protein-L-isoaspartate(D-aspartate) O-methyltransferase n=1 Tax=Longimicrobium sp. TaxID=2029185 RepID=UPI002E35F359|nr:protein-L-isoaspartate(D-aspartate) O-methyltransferase [Longimicrobium sp.]HEX6042082.1 protein-L-isoaspartate(D-aspartate) O-methyltransferase [Longimicrobium sp.]
MNDRYVGQRRALLGTMQERGIRDLNVLRAFDTVHRHEFIPEAVRHRSYEDAPVPIGFGQTASQPSLQALYMQVLELKPSDRVLEIGTGCGFQTAVLAQLADRVYSVERIRELGVRAREKLDALRMSNVAILVGDGTIGWSRYAPYDAILVAAGGPEIPRPLLEQMADGGRMLIPVGGRDMQQLVLVTRRGDDYEQRPVTDCTFVPLLGRFGWSTEAPPGQR